MSTTVEASKLLSTQPSEQESLPPAEVREEGQEAQVKQEATPDTVEAKQETPEGDTDAKPELHRVKVDGEEIEVEYEELKKGYSRESHYQKKARDLAADREALNAKTSELDAKIQDAQLIIDSELANLDSEDMQELRESDPDAYLRKSEQIQAKVKKFNDLKNSRQAELDEKNANLLAKEQEAMFDAFPSWKDDSKLMNDEYEELTGLLHDVGFSKEETNAITDHRMLVIANKLKTLDAIEKANLEAKKQETKPTAVKPAASTDRPEQTTTAKKQANEKFRKTGSFKDAAKLFQIN